MNTLDAGSMIECPLCGTFHIGMPGRCDITEAHIQMVTDYVGHHPGSDLIDVATGIGGEIARGYRACREALELGRIQQLCLLPACDIRYYPVPDPDDPLPMLPGDGHDVLIPPAEIIIGRPAARLEYSSGWDGNACPWGRHQEVPCECAYPLRSRCICGVEARMSSPDADWCHEIQSAN